MDAQVAALVARMDRLEAENAELRSRLDGVAPPPNPAPSATVDTNGSRRSAGRRHALRAGLAVAGAAAGAVLLEPRTAAAANGGAVILGTYNNGASQPTGIVASGFPGNVWGFGVADSTVSDYGNSPAIGAGASGVFQTGLKAIAGDQDGFVAVRAEAHGSSTGMQCSSDDGRAATIVSGTGRALDVASGNGSSTAQFTNSSTGSALVAVSDSSLYVGAHGGSVGYHAHLDTFGRQAPTLDATSHSIGHLVRESNGNLWWCVAAGTPGTWRKLSGPSTAGQLHLLNAPVRAYDSRAGTFPSGGSKTPLPANTARTIDLKNGSTGVPADATGVLVTILLVNLASGPGNFTIWANGVGRPSGNTMVFANTAASNRASSLAVTKVDASGQCQVYSSLKTDLTVDVVGYYR
jgi:hypothetical protein